MRGRITTVHGDSYDLPELLRWELCRTGAVPCDSFAIRCVYSADMFAILEQSCRFAAIENGAEVFCGVIDEVSVSGGEKGLLLEICGRGMAALLLDNETEAASYQRAALSELVRRHAEPYGIPVEAMDALAADGIYKVDSGSSEWKAIAEFTRRFGGFLPYVTKTGALRLTKDHVGKTLEIKQGAAVLSAVYCGRRYGPVSEILVIGRSGNLRETVKNEEALAQGGACRRVLYSTAKSREELRAAGEYQIEKSCEEAQMLTLELAGYIAAEPLDLAEVELPRLGIRGTFRVREVLRRANASGEVTRLRLEKE